MTATAVALAGSLLLNAALGWAFLTARAAADRRRASEQYMIRAYEHLRRNSVQRDPKTGRYMKKGTRA